jgi:hypothetical protein
MVNSINYKTNRPLWNFDVQYFNNSELWPTNHTYLPIEQNDQPTNKTQDPCHSQANPLHPSENSTNSRWQPIVFGNSRISSSNIRFRPNIYPTFLLTARYSIIQDNSNEKSYHHVQRKYCVQDIVQLQKE